MKKRGEKRGDKETGGEKKGEGEKCPVIGWVYHFVFLRLPSQLERKGGRVSGRRGKGKKGRRGGETAMPYYQVQFNPQFSCEKGGKKGKC